MMLLLPVLAACVSLCVARSTGPPLSPAGNSDYVCNAMAPNPVTLHGAGATGDGGYRLEISPPMAQAVGGFTFTPNTLYTIRLVGTTNTLRGFLVQARTPGGTPTLGVTPMLLGSFQPGSGQQTYDCDGAGVADQATITHSQNQNDANSVQFTWTAPSTAGEVDFYYTVMRVATTHFDALRARDVGLLAPTTAPPPVDTTDAPGTPAPTEPQTTPPPSNPTLPVRSPDNYRLQVLSPDGCSRSSCDLFIGIDTNTGDPGFLDIYMEGTAQGWLAVGFSETANMFLADVVSCNRLGDDIMAIDGRNPASPNRASTTDTIQDVTLHSSVYSSSNTRITCTVSKRIAPSGSGEDLDLTNSLFVIFARRVTPSTQLNSLGSHAVDGTGVRGASAQQFAIATETGVIGALPTGPTQPPATPPPGNPTPPVRSPDNYRLNISSPDGCSRSSCDLFIGIDTNSGDDQYIDIYMEGRAEGWLTVGFTATPNMHSADVVSCNRLEETFMAVDGWNPASPARDSIPDTIQDVVLHTSSFDSSVTRISCTVSKRIAPSNPAGSTEDLDLTERLYVIYGRRIRASTQLSPIETHFFDGVGARGVSQQFVVASDSGSGRGNRFESVHRPNLIRTHGILMVIAWPLLAISGIFFASFMKPALPNGEWFQVHRGFLLASLFIGATAFVLIFVALSNTNGLVNTSSGSSLAHMIMGIIIMALHIANPIVAIFRCKPNTENRWIFNLIHSIIGFTAQGLSFSNVAIGLSIFTSTISQTFSGSHAPLWVMVAWIIFYVVIVLVAFITFCVYAHVTKQRQCASPGVVSSMIKYEKQTEAVDVSSPGGGEKEKEKEPERKPPSKDAPLRWGFLVLYLAITVPILLAVIIMIAVP